MTEEQLTAPIVAADPRNALLAGQLLLKLIRARRFYLDEFMDGDVPYWIVIGLFVDQELGCETSFERVIEYADESIETSRHLLQMLIDREVVERYSSAEAQPAFRLNAAFNTRFAVYLQHQAQIMRTASSHFR